MSYMQVMLDFITCKFPFWGTCNFQFEPETKTIFIQCLTSEGRAKVLADASKISALDINVEQFIIKVPQYSDIIISHIR
ncbi:hypothetical protein NIES2101_30240 [Calothrix sp. HK-06]|nr:hypothetical protein NIES2101_30240 [Calothrix sp. HK-06]